MTGTTTTTTSNIGQQANNNNDAATVDHSKPLDLGRTLPLEQDSFSACLLVKDNNDILNEYSYLRDGNT
jgi:hypothetical protein